MSWGWVIFIAVVAYMLGHEAGIHDERARQRQRQLEDRGY